MKTINPPPHTAHPPEIDPVTGLLDRDGFVACLEDACRRAEDGAEGAVLFVDLDHFNACLQSYPGRTSAVLRKIADALRSVTGRHGRAARLSGDEFGVVLETGSGVSALELARALVTRVASTNFGTTPNPLYLTASVGVVPIEVESAAVDELMCTADAAAYAARNAGGNRAIVMRPNDTMAIRNVRAVRTLPQVRKALREGRLLLYCQPIVPLRASDKSLPAAEILVRMAGESGEVIPPSDFLPVAERFRLTSLIDREVVERSCRWLESRSGSWVDLDYVTLNLHAQSLADQELTQWIVRRIETGRFNPRRLCIEVTESAAIQQMDRARDLLARIRATGCRVALDDFGVGYSSLAHFQELPVDLVKIDGSFMRRIDEDAAARELVAWVCDLCRASERRTVAEHCSTPAILETVRELGVDYAQGYAVCEPFPLDRLLPVLTSELTLILPATPDESGDDDQSPRNMRYAGLPVSSA